MLNNCNPEIQEQLNRFIGLRIYLVRTDEAKAISFALGGLSAKLLKNHRRGKVLVSGKFSIISYSKGWRIFQGKNHIIGSMGDIHSQLLDSLPSKLECLEAIGSISNNDIELRFKNNYRLEILQIENDYSEMIHCFLPNRKVICPDEAGNWTMQN